MLISLYGSQVLEMGLFYSHVLKASPLLVKEIKVVIWILAEQRLIFYSQLQCEGLSGRQPGAGNCQR
ncbi:unnamed protein product [Sphagnum balticum]